MPVENFRVLSSGYEDANTMYNFSVENQTNIQEDVIWEFPSVICIIAAKQKTFHRNFSGNFHTFF